MIFALSSSREQGIALSLPARMSKRWRIQLRATFRAGRDIIGSFELTKPIIAAINGHCLAGAADIVMRCDIRIASENATFGIPEARVGLHVPGARLANLIPASLAMELTVTAESIDAQRAYEVGLVSPLSPRAGARLRR